MKFYAKIRSERAEKGQGGNEYLGIDISVGDAKNPQTIARFTVREGENDFGENVFGLYDEDDQCLRWIVADNDKKICRHCGRRHKNALCDGGTK